MRRNSLLWFVSVIGGVFCCNPDWLSYNNKCYRGIKFSYDVRLARRYCQIFRGDLAIIQDEHTLKNVAASLANFSDNSYWVHENSTLSETATDGNGCGYLYNETDNTSKLGYDSDCNKNRYFVCQVPDNEDPIECPKSWNLYGSTCYKTYKNLGTYEQAISFCSLQHAQLAVLDDIAKEHNAAAVIIGQKEVFLVAARNLDKDSIFKWSSGTEFHPSCPECRNNTAGDCIGFSSDRQHPTMFTWVNVNCSASNYYMCEMSPQPKTTTLAPVTTPKALECPVGYNWKVHQDSGFCFWETTYETERLNWFQARKFCQAYGGDLATYDNADQEEHGLGGAKGHYRGLWFGLKRKDDYDILQWVNNRTLNYTNWYSGEPNFRSRTKYCAMHGSHNSEWELDYCGVRRWFVCKAPKTQEPKLPNIDLFKKTPCNFSGPSIYKNQWFLYEDHCYLFRDADKYSWNTAKYFCQDNGGHMASIHSFEETNFILQLVPSSSSMSNYWIGLSAKDLESPLSWSDGSPLDFLYWEDGYNVSQTVQKCVTFEKTKGFWNTEHCNKFLGVICKRGVNASYDLPTVEPTQTLPGNCEKEWYRFGNKCFKSFGQKWSQRLSWHDASNDCQQYGGTLVSIHNADEQDFVTDLVLDIGTSAWTGLENTNKGTIFQWNDDSALDYTNWNANEPMDSDSSVEEPTLARFQSRLCVELEYDTVGMGKWSDTSCHNRKAYICQKSPNQTITQPSDDPFACYNISGWNKLGNSCYKVFEENNQDWAASQAKCRNYDANLLVFRSSALAVFLQKRFKRKDQFYWIGVRETQKNKYESILRRNTFGNWLRGQPQRTSEMDNCVAINSNGKWIVKNCKEKHPFLCELSHEEEGKGSETEDDNLACPKTTTWVDVGSDKCYFYGYERISWNHAFSMCFRYGGNLASFHSEEEIKLVRDWIKSETDSSFHIGLSKLSDGTYKWVDHSPYDFTFWENDIAPYSIMNCVQMHPATAKWRPVDCMDMNRHYICACPKGNYNNGNTRSANSSERNESYTEQKISYKIGVGGIMTIIICVALVLAIIGGTVYRFYPTSRVKRTLLEPENL